MKRSHKKDSARWQVGASEERKPLMSTTRPNNSLGDNPTPSNAEGLRARLNAKIGEAADAAFVEHLIEIVCSGDEDVLSRAVNNTRSTLDRKILTIVGTVKAAMVEAIFYQQNSALTDEPQPLPVQVDEPNPQHKMASLARHLRDQVAGLLDELPRFEHGVTLPYASYFAGQFAESVTGSVAYIATLVATIMQLQEIAKTHSGATE
jgi:hypothetical protein